MRRVGETGKPGTQISTRHVTRANFSGSLLLLLQPKWLILYFSARGMTVAFLFTTPKT